MSDEQLFLLKGVVSGLALIALLFHMVTTHGDMSLARALRYVALLSAAAAIAFASQEQLNEVGVEWRPRNWGGVITATLVLAASIASIMEDRGIRLPTMTLKRARR